MKTKKTNNELAKMEDVIPSVEIVFDAEDITDEQRRSISAPMPHPNQMTAADRAKHAAKKAIATVKTALSGDFNGYKELKKDPNYKPIQSFKSIERARQLGYVPPDDAYGGQALRAMIGDTEGRMLHQDEGVDAALTEAGMPELIEDKSQKPPQEFYDRIQASGADASALLQSEDGNRATRRALPNARHAEAEHGTS